MAARASQQVVQTVATPSPKARATQQNAQTVTTPTPLARAGQLVVHTVTFEPETVLTRATQVVVQTVGPPPTVNMAATQLVVQVVSPPVTIPAQATQQVVQVLNRDPIFNRGHVTQTPLELARGGAPPLLETQAPVELIFFQRNGITTVRGSQAAIELLFFQRAGLTLVDVSQVAVEIIHTNGCLAPRPVPSIEPFATFAHPIRRLRRAPHLAEEDRRLYFDELALDLETGVGLTTGQGSDPQIMLRYSDDGGHTWSDEIWVTAGAIGEYGTEAVWRRLGSSRDRIFEVTMSDPVRWVIVSAYLRVTGGAH